MIVLITITFSISVFFLLIAFFYSLGKKEDKKKKRIDDIKDIGKRIPTAKKEKEKIGIKDKINLYLKENKKKKEGKNRKKREKSNKKTSALEEMLIMTGTEMTAEQFSMIKVILAAIFMILALIICKILKLGMTPLILIMAIVGLLAIILPGRWLKMKVKKRQEAMRNQLPDVMDLLVVSVEAGLGFDAALLRLYEKDKSELMTEMIQATRDIQRGMSKKEAYESLAKRCNLSELTTFLTALVQSDQLGISIKSVLKVQSENLRKERSQRAEEKALKAPVKMLVPMVVFIFPVIFIILLGPAVVNIMDVF
jgi:tight adherence protein C